MISELIAIKYKEGIFPRIYGTRNNRKYGPTPVSQDFRPPYIFPPPPPGGEIPRNIAPPGVAKILGISPPFRKFAPL
jgi:hypothetical protein